MIKLDWNCFKIYYSL